MQIERISSAVLPFAEVALETGQLETAKRSYQNLLRVHPDSFQARMGLGEVELRRRNPAEAARWFVSALASASTRPERHDALLAHGRAALDAGHLEAARGSFARLTDPQEGASNAHVAFGLNGVGLTFMIDGDLRSAVTLMEQAVELLPHDQKLRGNLSLSLRNLAEQVAGTSSAANEFATPGDVAEQAPQPSPVAGPAPDPALVAAASRIELAVERFEQAAERLAGAASVAAASAAVDEPVAQSAPSPQQPAQRPPPESRESAAAAPADDSTAQSALPPRLPQQPVPRPAPESRESAAVAPADDDSTVQSAPPRSPQTPAQRPPRESRESAAAPPADDDSTAQSAPPRSQLPPPESPESAAAPPADPSPSSQAVPDAAPAATSPPSPPPRDPPPEPAPAAPAGSVGFLVSDSEGLFVQMGAYGTAAAADAMGERLRGITEQPVRVTERGGLHRVRIGPLKSRDGLQALVGALREAGFGGVEAVDEAPTGPEPSAPEPAAPEPSPPPVALQEATPAPVARPESGQVPVEAVRGFPVDVDGNRLLQMGAYGNEGVAETLALQLRAVTDERVRVASTEVNGEVLHRVRIGPVAADDWRALTMALTAAGYDIEDPRPREAFVARNGAGTFVQFGAFKARAAAASMARQLRDWTNEPVSVSQAALADGASVHRVQIGPLASDARLARLIDALRTRGFRVTGATETAADSALSEQPQSPPAQAAPVAEAERPAPPAAALPDEPAQVEDPPPVEPAVELSPPTAEPPPAVPDPVLPPGQPPPVLGESASATEPEPLPPEPLQTAPTDARDVDSGPGRDYQETYVTPEAETGVPPPTGRPGSPSNARAFVTTEDQGVFVRIGDYHAIDAAEDVAARMRVLTTAPVEVIVDEDGPRSLHRVRVGPVETDTDFEALLAAVEALGFDIH